MQNFKVILTLDSRRCQLSFIGYLHFQAKKLTNFFFKIRDVHTSYNAHSILLTTNMPMFCLYMQNAQFCT